MPMETNTITEPSESILPQNVIDKLEKLQQAILTAHPSMPTLLKQIHDQLKADPAIVTILTEEQKHIIVSGLAKHAKVELLTAQLKKTNVKAMKNTTADDI